MREVPLLERHKRLLLTADAGCERRASQHPLSDVAVGVSQTSEQATHRADVDELARPIIHVVHQLIQHHGWVCIDNGLQRLLFSDCEHRASLCIRVPLHDVPGIEEESHPLLDGRRHRSLRVPSSAGRTIAHELAAISQQKGNLVVAEPVIQIQCHGERASVLLVHGTHPHRSRGRTSAASESTRKTGRKSARKKRVYKKDIHEPCPHSIPVATNCTAP